MVGLPLPPEKFATADDEDGHPKEGVASQGHKNRRFYSKLYVTLMLCISCIITISVVGAFILNNHTFLSAYNITSHKTTAKHFDNTSTEISVFTEKAERNFGGCRDAVKTQRITASTFFDYHSQLSVKTRNDPCANIALFIYSADFYSWPATLVLPEIPPIVEMHIAGPLKIDQLVGLLRQAKSIENISFNNTSSQLSLGTKPRYGFSEEIQESYVNLPNVKYFAFSNLNSGSNIVSWISTCINMKPSVVEVDGNVNDENVQDFLQLVCLFYESTEELVLKGRFDTQVNVIPKRCIMSKLKTLTIDMQQQGSKRIVDHRICTRLPYLSKLSLNNMNFTVEELQNLNTCSKLQELEIDFVLEVDEIKNINYSSIISRLPHLTSLDITVSFQKCPSFEQFSNLIEDLKQFTILSLCSNCVIIAERNQKCLYAE